MEFNFLIFHLITHSVVGIMLGLMYISYRPWDPKRKSLNAEQYGFSTQIIRCNSIRIQHTFAV